MAVRWGLQSKQSARDLFLNAKPTALPYVAREWIIQDLMGYQRPPQFCFLDRRSHYGWRLVAWMGTTGPGLYGQGAVKRAATCVE